MKKLASVALVALFVTIGAGRLFAYDHDDKGYWTDKDHHHHHPFIVHDGHRGYYDEHHAFISVNL